MNIIKYYYHYMYTHDSCSYATQPRMNSTPSVGLVLRRRSRVMSLIRSQVVTSRSLFQTVGYQVTCMHITVSLITFIELLSIHCKHDTHKSTVLVRFCSSAARNERAGKNKEADRESAVFSCFHLFAPALTI